jgi:hypothetical protein
MIMKVSRVVVSSPPKQNPRPMNLERPTLKAGDHGLCVLNHVPSEKKYY